MKTKSIIFLVALALVVFLQACSVSPQPIEYGKDVCEFCKMTIMDKKFGAEMLNQNGKAVKFDSGECMVNYMNTNTNFKAVQYLVVSYNNPGQLIDAEKSCYIHGGNVNSPMGGNLASFSDKSTAEQFQSQLQGELIHWNEVVKISF